LKWLRKAIDVCFDYDRTLSGRSLALLGVALKYQKDYEKAELAFKKALKSLNGV
jgi:tetratricopeptide (TPR) repeat protein